MRFHHEMVREFCPVGKPLTKDNVRALLESRRMDELTVSSNQDSRWWTAQQVATFLGLRVDEVPRLLGRGKIPRPSYHLGYASPRWDRTVLEASRPQRQSRRQPGTE
jgi:hypothetical protein